MIFAIFMLMATSKSTIMKDAPVLASGMHKIHMADRLQWKSIVKVTSEGSVKNCLVQTHYKLEQSRQALCLRFHCTPFVAWMSRTLPNSGVRHAINCSILSIMTMCLSYLCMIISTPSKLFLSSKCEISYCCINYM